jgi:hypothetical protein
MEAATRAAARHCDEPGGLAVTRHGMVQASAAAAAPPATDTRAPTAIADADMRPPGPVPGRQYRTMEQRSGLSASTSALPIGGRANADIGRSSKSP